MTGVAASHQAPWPEWRLRARALNDRFQKDLEQARLICEIPDFGEELFTELHQLMVSLTPEEFETVVQYYWYLTAVWIALAGALLQVDGALWDRIQPPLTQAQQKAIGGVFLRVAERLRSRPGAAPDIDDTTNVQKYLGPIIFHGGISRSSLNDFIRLLEDSRDRGVDDARSMLMWWRQRPRAFRNLENHDIYLGGHLKSGH